MLGSVSLLGFAQLTDRESPRDIETRLRALGGKLYHLGIRGPISRSTLADANETRDWRIFADPTGFQMLVRENRGTISFLRPAQLRHSGLTGHY